MIRKLVVLAIAILVTYGLREYNLRNHKEEIKQAEMESSAWHKEVWEDLYTYISLTASTSPEEFAQILKEIKQEFRSYTILVQANSKLDSVIYNASVGDTISLDSMSYDLFAYGLQKFSETKGVINVGIGNLLRTWGFLWHQKPRLPTSEELKFEVENLKSPFYSLIPEKKAIRISKAKQHYAVGAYSKGYALDLAYNILKKYKVQHFLLEVGGDIVYSGMNKTRSLWKIGIQDPTLKHGIKGIVSLPESFNSMATSGGYEKYFVDSLGVKHHHILNPTTGDSPRDKQSITVISKTGLETDFLATYLFILPNEQVQQLAESNPNYEVILIFNDNTVWTSSTIKPYFQLQ